MHRHLDGQDEKKEEGIETFPIFIQTCGENKNLIQLQVLFTVQLDYLFICCTLSVQRSCDTHPIAGQCCR